MKTNKNLLATMALLLLASTASAQTWDRGASTDFWADADNWNPDGVPASGASVIFDTTGAGTVNLGGVTRNVTDVTIQGTAGYTFANGTFNIDGVFTNNASAGTQATGGSLYFQGTGSVVLNRTLRLGSFATLNVAGGNQFSGGTIVGSNTAGATLLLEYGAFTGTDFVYQFGTGAIQMGTATNGSNGGVLSFNSSASSRMTMANNFVNGITRADNFGSNQFEIRYDGGIGVATASVTRLTGDFSTAALTGGATGHGWTTIRGRAVVDSTRPFSAATFELSGNWTNYAPVSSKIALMHGAFVLENANSVANHAYTLNANNTAAQSTVLALGSGFGANTFNRNITVEVGTTGNTNAADAINQTYIGGRQSSGTTNTYSSNITFNNANAHRLNLFSEDGRTNFSGNLAASADQVVAINSNYSMATYTSVSSVGITLSNALTAMTPDGVVAFTGGTKTFAGGVEVTRGTLLINQTITGNVNVASGAVLGTDGGTGVITGNLTLANGALLAFSPTNSLSLSGTLTLDNSFGVASLRTATGDAIDWSLIGDNTYTLLTGASLPTFSSANIANYGSVNAYDIGGGRKAYFENGSLALTVIPEPGTLALVAVALGSLLLFRRRRSS